MSAGHIVESTSNQAFTNIRFRDHLEDTSIFKNCHLGLSSLGTHWTQWLLLDVDDPFGLGSSKLTLDDERLYSPYPKVLVIQIFSRSDQGFSLPLPIPCDPTSPPQPP